jgi:hypothetical protein
MGGNTKREVVMDPLTGVWFHKPSYPLPEGDLIEFACSCLERLTPIKKLLNLFIFAKDGKKPPIPFFDAFKCLSEMERLS